MNIDTIKEMIKEKLLEALKNEAAKPDFPDIDGDGDREEPISKAAKDKKGKVDEEQEILEEDFWSQAQKYAEEECRHLSGDSYGMCFRRKADKEYSRLIQQSQSSGGGSSYGSGRDHLISFYEENQKVETPEHENNLYESRFRDRDSKLFEKLKNKWVK